MKATTLCATLILLLGTFPAGRADVLELKNGTILNGRYTGGTAGTVRFETSAGVQVLETSQIIALTFTAPAATSSAPAISTSAPTITTPAPVAISPSAVASTSAPVATTASTAAAKPQTITLPAGTMLLVRMGDSISSRNSAGTPFSAKLEYDLGAGGVVALKAGTTFYGKVQTSSQAGRALGRSTLDLRLTQIVAGSQPVPIMTSGHKEAGQASIAKAARGAGAGAAIGAVAGDAGKGAAIGATAGALVRGQTITVPTGTLLEFSLTQPVTVTAAN